MIFDLLNVSAFSDIGIQVYVGIQLFYENWVFISWSKDYSYCQKKYIKLQRYIRLMHEKARFCFLSWNLINFFTAVLWATTLVVRNMLVSWLFLFTYLFFTAAIVLAIFEVGVMMLWQLEQPVPWDFLTLHLILMVKLVCILSALCQLPVCAVAYYVPSFLPNQLKDKTKLWN